MAAVDFWNNKDRAQTTIDEATALRGKILPLDALVQKTDDLEILKSLAEEETDTKPVNRVSRSRKVYSRGSKELESFELQMLLSGEFDKNNAFVTIHAGAGGTESCDWADMLFRMYQRWIERNGFKQPDYRHSGGRRSRHQIRYAARDRRISPMGTCKPNGASIGL